VSRNMDQKSCNELCNQIIEAADFKATTKRRVNKLHSEMEVGTTVPTTTNASSNGANRDSPSVGSFVKISLNQKPKGENKKRPV